MLRRFPMAKTALLALVLAAGCAKIQARDLVREGNELYRDGRFVEAIQKYDEAEKLEPDGVTLFWNRACAAESLVLKMKDPKQAAERKKYADMALRDFQTWYDRLPEKTENDAEQIEQHRLAILDADERCDDLISYWIDKHRENPKEESLYGVVARQYEKCGRDKDADEWFVKRTEDFPDSVRAWHALAIRRFEPLWPDPDSGLPYNAALSPSERRKIADEVIRLLDKATAIDPNFRDAYVWRAMAYTQRALSRAVLENPETPEEKLEAILARKDTLMAWKQQKALCDIEQLPDCPTDKPPEGACCPPRPISEEEEAQDAEMERDLREQLEPGKKKRRKRRRRRR